MKDDDVYNIYDIIESLSYNENTIYISFAIDNLHAIRRKNPNQAVQYLIGGTVPSDLMEILEKYRFDLDIYFKAASKELIDACHSIGAKINVWTVDNTEVAENLVRMGIDFITTNIIE